MRALLPLCIALLLALTGCSADGQTPSPDAGATTTPTPAPAIPAPAPTPAPTATPAPAPATTVTPAPAPAAAPKPAPPPPAPVVVGPCLPRAVAPATLPNPRGGGDAGVMTSGFLDLRDDGNGVYQVAHGVDLSDHNQPDYDALKSCGSDFAIIKIYPYNPKFNSAQVKELTARNIAVLPYYYLVMPEKYKYFPEQFSTDDALQAEITDAQATGQLDAQAFLQSYDQQFGSAYKVSIAGLSGELIALDVEEAFQTTTPAALAARKGQPALRESAITPDEIDRYGQTYGAMLGEWVKTVQAAHPDAIVIFYTYPEMYLTYLLSARTDDFNIIRGLPVWLAEYTQHGGDYTDAGATVKQGAQRLCLSSSGGNKCVIQQYTSRGLFGQVHPPGADPLHIDLNRFFLVDVIPDGSGVQYVRKAAYVDGAAPATPPPAPKAAPATPAPAAPTPVPAPTPAPTPPDPPPAAAPDPSTATPPPQPATPAPG